MGWHTGTWTSTDDEGRAFLEKHSDDKWWAYKLGEDGRLLDGFPKLREEPFDTVEEAQEWVEAHVEKGEVDG